MPWPRAFIWLSYLTLVRGLSEQAVQFQQLPVCTTTRAGRIMLGWRNCSASQPAGMELGQWSCFSLADQSSEIEWAVWPGPTACGFCGLPRVLSPALFSIWSLECSCKRAAMVTKPAFHMIDGKGRVGRRLKAEASRQHNPHRISQFRPALVSRG